MRRKRILLTCVGSPMAHMIIKSLSSYNVYGIDKDKDAMGQHFVKKFYHVDKTGTAYNNEVLDICKQEKIDFLIPGADEEVFTIYSEVSRYYALGVQCAIPHNAYLYQGKDLMYKFLENNNIDVPKWCIVDEENIEEIYNYLNCFKEPLIIKIASGRGGRGIWKITDYAKSSIVERQSIPEKTLDEIDNILYRSRPNPTLIAMEYLEGDFYDVDILGDIVIPRKRINPVGIPFRGNIIENNKDIIEISRKVQKALKNRYLYDIDICLTKAGPKILEVNPRPSGSVAAMTVLGVNMFDLMVKSEYGDVGNIEIPFGRKVVPYTTAKEVK